MASLRFENFDLSLSSKASTNSLGALNSTSSISCLIFVFLGNATAFSPSYFIGMIACQPVEKQVIKLSLPYLK
jgi:hypothetical protein